MYGQSPNPATAYYNIIRTKCPINNIITIPTTIIIIIIIISSSSSINIYISSIDIH